jgi:hypothetical protein
MVFTVMHVDSRPVGLWRGARHSDDWACDQGCCWRWGVRRSYRRQVIVAGCSSISLSAARTSRAR